MNKSNYFRLSLVVCSLLFLGACDRPTKEASTKLNITVQGFENRNNLITPYQLNPDGTNNPTSIGQINCLGIMVSGPENYLRRNECTYAASGVKFNVGYFVGGKFVGSSSSATFDLDIRSGRDRVLKLVGFSVNTSGDASLAARACKDFDKVEEYESYLSDPYILAEAGQLEFPAGGTASVNLNAAFSVSNKIGDCSGPDFGNQSSGGAPAGFRIRIQDAGLGSLPSLFQNSCVGVKFSLADAIGKEATVTTPVTAVIKTQLPSHGFYYEGSEANWGCAAGQLTPISGDLTVTFAPGQASKTLFVRPSGMASPEIRIEDPMNVITSFTQFYSYDNSNASPFRFQIYDVFNNRSSASTSGALPIIVRRDECRPSAITLSKDDGVRITHLFSGDASRGINITTNAPTAVHLFSSMTECQTNQTGVSALSIPVTSSPFIFDNFPFTYKVVSQALTTFSFSVQNNAALGAILLPSGDLLPGTNFWRAQ